jgi:hypothetical protein
MTDEGSGVLNRPDTKPMPVVASHTGHRLRDGVPGPTSSHRVRHATVPVVLTPAQDSPMDTTIASGHAADHG